MSAFLPTEYGNILDSFSLKAHLSSQHHASTRQAAFSAGWQALSKHIATAAAGHDPFLDRALQQSVDTVLRLQQALEKKEMEILDDVMQDVRETAELWKTGHLPQPELKDGVNTPEGWQVSAAPLACNFSA